MSLFDSKAKQFVDGQKNLIHNIEKENIKAKNPIWFHCSSLGEFEQARQLIDGLYDAGEKILLTFFSPSGYQHRKDYKKADWVFYLPFDTKKNAESFIQHTNPKVAIFVKYDLWYFYLQGLKNKAIPSYLISAIYQNNQIYFRAISGKLHRRMLNMFEHIYLQDIASSDLLRDIGITQTSIIGDTRVDSVIDRAEGIKPLPLVEKFLAGEKAIILGSAYTTEVELLADVPELINKEKIIIAPHDIGRKNVAQIRKLMPQECSLYSELKSETQIKSNILIIDNIGTLFSCYQYGKWAFIGGAFGKGLHNTLEPAAFGLPLCFGPRYTKFAEAQIMVKNKTAKIINNPTDLKALYLQLEDKKKREELSLQIHAFIKNSQGASERIQKEILQKM